MTSRYIVQYGGAIQLYLSSTKLLQGASSEEKDDIFAYDLNSRRQTTFYKKRRSLNTAASFVARKWFSGFYVEIVDTLSPKFRIHWPSKIPNSTCKCKTRHPEPEVGKWGRGQDLQVPRRTRRPWPGRWVTSGPASPRQWWWWWQWCWWWWCWWDQRFPYEHLSCCPLKFKVK